MDNCLDIVNNAINNFQVDGIPRGCVPHGNGHINDTFFLICDKKSGKNNKYIIQALNTNVFTNPDAVMSNIQKVTEYLGKITDDKRRVMQIIHTYNNNVFYRDRLNNYWRMYTFIDNSICLEHPESTDDFYECAVAFGKFQHDLSNFPADTLFETIRDFHNTPKRYENFLNAVKNDSMGRAKNCEAEIEFIKRRKDFYSILIESHKEGTLPLRVSHNDTKSNNVMLDKKSHKALCVIDLDTIMPGFSVTDFGDAIRFGANNAEEDEKDLSKVWLNIDMFKIYTKGFLDGCDGELLDSEIMLLPEGAKMMTIECGMRFLTDYLEGDTYFKTNYDEHNLVRARTQLKLVSDMERQWDEMKSIVKKFCKQ